MQKTVAKNIIFSTTSPENKTNIKGPSTPQGKGNPDTEVVKVRGCVNRLCLSRCV